MIANVLQEFLKTGTSYLLLPLSGFIISLVLSLLRRPTKKQKILPKRKAQVNARRGNLRVSLNPRAQYDHSEFHEFIS
jgi:hypothetical protein